MKRESLKDSSNILKSAAHWRMRAEEMRTLSDEARDTTVRAMMRRIAADYDRLAEHADDNKDTVDSMIVRMAADYDELMGRASYGTQGLMDVILDPETRKSLAFIRNGQVFRDDNEGAQIATILGSYLYDLSGNLVGCLQGGHVIDPSTQSTPIAFRKLLEDNC